jgi:hypothetical protein
MFLGCFFTIAVYTFVFIRIKIYKATGDKHLRSKILEALDKKSLTDYLITLFYIIFVCIHLVLILKINSLDSSKMHVYPNYLYVYYYNLLMISVFSITLTLLYCARNRPLRKALLRKIRQVPVFELLV